jgi:molybdopterin-guanine dinucleotide biosynthesis protein A
MSHEKHTKLPIPAYGNFHRQEWAILGTNCTDIQRLTDEVISCLSAKYRIGYIDADHKAEKEASLSASPYQYTDRIRYHQLSFTGSFGNFERRSAMHMLDAVLVNGNHFEAARQIVCIDPKKEDSLRRKLDQLTQVTAFVMTGGACEIFPFLYDRIPNAGELPVFHISETEKIASLLDTGLGTATPPLRGLVLAGGRSSRMGTDKSKLQYHGKAQRDYAAELIRPMVQEVFYSCRPDQAAEFGAGEALISDTFTGLGPFGAILSAFREQPDSALLVLACDLPLLDVSTLQFLTRHRHPGRLATAFRNPATDFPEPLVTIWEPRAYPRMLQFLSQGVSCPRKVLIHSHIELLESPNPLSLKNANTPEEAIEIAQILKNH